MSPEIQPENSETQRRPTTAELTILRVLWGRGPSTVRDVHAALENGTGYTTVLKLLQIMAEKGLVVRDEGQRAHVYKAAVGRDQTQRQLVGDLLTRAFDGSASRFMLQLLSTSRASADEVAELRRMLEEYARGERGEQ